MKGLLILVLLCITTSGIAQSNTEVYLFDLNTTKEGLVLSNQRNISNNKGYDNQPSFYNDNIILFSSTRNEQTDIAAYNIRDAKVNWISNTTIGSEYSPTKIPNQKAVSAIRLDTTGKQLLYTYNYKTGKSKVLLENLKVGYHTWFTKNMIVSSVLEDGGLSLVVSNLLDNSNHTMQKKIGRSLHKIPNSKLISYISKEQEQWEIKSLNPISGATKKIVNTIPEAEDMCWLINGSILMGKGNQIYIVNPKTDTDWRVFHTFKNRELGNITRIATNATSTLLAVVSDTPAELAVRDVLDSYNQKDINAFLNNCTKDVALYNYPNYKTSHDLSSFKKFYKQTFTKVKDLNTKVREQIIIGNYVINKEEMTFANHNYLIIKMYEVTDGKVSKIIHFDKSKPEQGAAKIVDEHLAAYNSRNIDAYIAKYADNIKVSNFPDQTLYKGKEQLKNEIASLLEKTPDLNRNVKNRIVYGKMIINEEYLTVNGKKSRIIAIYKVTNGKIKTLTYIL
ncbi:nuclear transport factor 2 family protein [Aquimarina sp. MMG016]|uniref:nuclear transport factor 2 family protein n=1 Tax=Aquimarina sp. MMG016 TaxID=2822690 RepID=UPI001B3A54EC|nr:nuclear transport factor 2 family protein [Aquimarina sp. MMG016]MBQ4821836.1 nuclear transport factor 2 family protein [Aquimarina sp. MMG016]